MNNAAEKIFADIKVGDSAEFAVELTTEMVDIFARLSGDFNPLHMDETFTSKTAFKGRVVHGMLGASLFSQLIGMHLPGKYALYLSQSLNFKKPARIGMKVLVKGVVSQKINAARSIKVHTTITNSANDECLIDGEALVKVLE